MWSTRKRGSPPLLPGAWESSPGTPHLCNLTAGAERGQRAVGSGQRHRAGGAHTDRVAHSAFCISLGLETPQFLDPIHPHPAPSCSLYFSTVSTLGSSGTSTGGHCAPSMWSIHTHTGPFPWPCDPRRGHTSGSHLKAWCWSERHTEIWQWKRGQSLQPGPLSSSANASRRGLKRERKKRKQVEARLTGFRLSQDTTALAPVLVHWLLMG